jgi:tetratricopeptide (TPR) repeat protein
MKTKSLIVVLGALISKAAMGKFAMPMPAPVERLIENTQAYIKENPEDAHGYYVLGRIHYLAFARETDRVPLFGDKDDRPAKVAPEWLSAHPKDAEWHKRAVELTLREYGYSSVHEVKAREALEFWDKVRENTARVKWDKWDYWKNTGVGEALGHVEAARTNLEQAIALDKENGLYYLGLGSLFEQYLDFAGKIDANDVGEKLKGVTVEKARDAYYKAYELSIKRDLKRKDLPVAGLRSMVGHEAGQGYLRMWEGVGDISKDDAERIGRVKKDVGKLQSLPRGAITPVVFSMEKGGRLKDLLIEQSVRFDLDGDGISEMLEWVKPTTGILVWDPEGKGAIVSGRQMFGSVTWWLFFEDGYYALDALDDNRDGKLSGRELNDIAVWFDKDSDGQSDMGEVIPVGKVGIASIATKATGYDGASPGNDQGIEFKGSRIVSSYDWIAAKCK